MSEYSAGSHSSMQDLLSKVSRYEALFELAGVISAAADIESVGDVSARRLKFIADVYAWRYICIDGEDLESSEGPEPTMIVVDGYRGRADVMRAPSTTLSNFEAGLWRGRKTLVLYGDPMIEALEQLPVQFRRADLEQVLVNTLVENGKTQALFLFCKRRQPFTDLDLKCLSMLAGFFHRKVHTLWQQQKLRDLELAYLQQEVMLRQSEKLATIGRLSAGMAHELNNPAAVARQGAEHLRTSIARLEQAQFALGEAKLSNEQCDLIARLENDAEERAKKPTSLDPIAGSDLQEEVEDWLDRQGINDSWEHASTLVAMGVCAAELKHLTERFDASLMPIVVDYLASKFTAYKLVEEIGQGALRIVDIVKALKGYSYMDQAPIQAVDVREGLNDTLVLLSSKLRDGISVDCNFEENLPRLQGYGGELNQVWTNLIDNAISAMSGKGKLGLSAYQDNSWVVVEVADNGPGIPVEIQQKIFDPFFTTKAPGEGTGLGLNISHAIIVDKHAGQIAIDSKPGATRFVVKLPITGQPSAIKEDNEVAAEPC